MLRLSGASSRARGAASAASALNSSGAGAQEPSNHVYEIYQLKVHLTLVPTIYLASFDSPGAKIRIPNGRDVNIELVLVLKLLIDTYY